MEALPPKLRKLWKYWDIRVAILLSLILQIALIHLGNRRKHNSKLRIRIVLWCACLASDSVATFALGIISNNLTYLYEYEKSEILGPSTELTTFWAPFLLLHMGGADTITAYALEDNELWLRHLLGLIVHSAIALSVFLMAWTTGSHVSILSIPMLFVGLIKYGERTWALRSASTDKLRDSLSEEREQARPIKPPFPVCIPVINDNSNSIFSEQSKLRTAYEFLVSTKRLFFDSKPISLSEKIAESVYRYLSFENAFELVEMELGFMYDLFYTKAQFLHTRCGFALRIITFFLTSSVLILFTFLVHRNKYPEVDICITFLLLVAAIFMEIYSVFLIISSDRFVVWSSMHSKKTSILQAIKIRSSPNPRWSNKMLQLSLVSLFLDEKPLPYRHILKLLSINHKKLEKQWYLSQKQVSKDLKELIFLYFKSYNEQQVLRYYKYSDVDPESLRAPSFEEEPGESIFFWHSLTEVLYYFQRDWIKKQNKPIAGRCKSIKQISRYMMCLLLVHPSMLSIDAIDPMSFQKTLDEYRIQLKSLKVTSKTEACKKMIEKAGKSSTRRLNKLFERAIASARKIDESRETHNEKKWNDLGRNWMILMKDAARKSKGREHAQQLRRGGELYSHVWLLMTHFCLNQRYQTV
ncbi:Protein of unknown function (DUF594) [Melia azedarach]|uniref:Uncharacterized protein n=1 Tax=Melia azedarach TaxID=155640 RepID=A0ACC1YKC6_MELAZ|nr:Protein of unknown function (DUF594) [Melia azedarach]